MANDLMPIAIIGMSCRFPGDATNVENFWDFLAQGRSSAQEVPKDRFNIDSYYHPSSTRNGGIKTKRGHFLKEDVSKFDAPFFSMTMGEADATDPQQRLLLELAYEAFENAGQPIHKLAGSKTSVYSSCFITDYTQISSYDPLVRSLHESTGHSSALVSNRVSWFFDLRGPSMTIDTGCSGSTVAFHLACESLRSGEAESALACGVNLILAPDAFIGMTAFNFISPDGLSYSFDYRAQGYSRGEGFAAVMLKPLAAAIRDNDPIRAVVRSSAVAQDGRTPGITLPSRDAQASLIRHTYARARLGLEQTAFFEAHGTGTAAGDAAELGAIGDVFANSRQVDLLVGSAKTNVGHLEGTAGLAGIIKATLAVERAHVPGNLNFQKPREENDLNKYRIEVPTQLKPWPIDGLRRASINCFGFGGTIAHIILDEPPTLATSDSVMAETSATMTEDLPANDGHRSKRRKLATPASIKPSMPQLLLWSAPEKEAVPRNIESTLEYLRSKECTHPDDLISDLAYTLSDRRSRFPWRSFKVAGTLAEARETKPGVPTQAIDGCQVCFVFPGQGAQWARMGHELTSYLIFRDRLQEADTFIRSLGATWSILEELDKAADCSRIDEPEISQTACTVIQTALADLLNSWDVKPANVIGHSSGEIAAAYCCGALSRHDAWKLAYLRGKAASFAAEGAMLAIGLPEEDVAKHLDILHLKDRVEIACVNSPENTTVSGDPLAIDVLEKRLKDEHVFFRRLKVQTAYHSKHMQEPGAYYLSEIGTIRPWSDTMRCSMVSSVTGGVIKAEDLNAEYFVKNLTSPVRFSAAVEASFASRAADFVLEIGPHGVLQSAIRETLSAKNLTLPPYATMLLRGRNAAETALECMGKVWCRGGQVDVSAINNPLANKVRCLSTLPPYSWNHKRSYWFESDRSKSERLRKFPRHDLLGVVDIGSNNINMCWRNFITPRELPWVKDHQVQGSTLYPAAGMLAMVLEAARQINIESNDVEGFELRDVHIEKAMVIPDAGHGLETILHMKPMPDHVDVYDFDICSRTGESPFKVNCRGSLSIRRLLQPATDADTAMVDSRRDSPLDDNNDKISDQEKSPEDMYQKMATLGMEWGPTFQNLVKMDNEGDFQVRIPDTATVMPANWQSPHLIHPAALDALFHSLVFSSSQDGSPKVPTAIDYVYISNDLPKEVGSIFDGTCQITSVDSRSLMGSITASSKSTGAAIVFKGLQCTDIGSPDQDDDGTKQTMCTKVIWEELKLPTEESAIQRAELVIVRSGQKSTFDGVRDLIERELSDNFNVTISSLEASASAGTEGNIVLVLLELGPNGVAEWSQTEYEQVQSILLHNKKLLWITRGATSQPGNPGAASLMGMFRSLRFEDATMRWHTLDLPLDSIQDDERTGSTIARVMKHITSPGKSVEDFEYSIRDGKILVPRVVPDDAMNESMLASLAVPESVKPTDVEVEVISTGSSGSFAGTITKIGTHVNGVRLKDRVVGLQGSQAVGTVWCSSEDIQAIPQDVTFEAAAAIYGGAMMKASKQFEKDSKAVECRTRVEIDRHSLSGHLREDVTYLIVGGLGGIGRSIASLLVSHGARNVVFLSRSGGDGQDSQAFLSSLKQQGVVTALALACDVSKKNQLRDALEELRTALPPIKGVIHAAMVLRDHLFENMAHGEFQAVLQPKIRGSWNLHELLPADLDFFIMLSSIAGIGGMRGQTNYAAGNAYQDALACHRRNMGMLATSIDLTVVLGVGVVAENPELLVGLQKAGVLTIPEEAMHKLLKAAIVGQTSNGTPTPAQVIVGVASGGYIDRHDIQDSMWPHDDRFKYTMEIGRDSSSVPLDTSTNLPIALRTAATMKEATILVLEALVAKLARALAVASEDIDVNKSVSDYGVDSLIAVELRSWIQRQAGASVSVFDLMSELSVGELAGRIVAGSDLVQGIGRSTP